MFGTTNMNDIIINAQRLAYRAHETLYPHSPDGKQWRSHCNPPVPYFHHVMRVQFMVSQHPECTPIMSAAAVLHDTLEDTTLDPREIETQCGAQVLFHVQELVNASLKLTPEEKKKHKRPARKKMDRDKIATISRYAKIIKYYDMIDNLEDLAGADPDWVKTFSDEKKLVAEVLKGTDEALDARLQVAIENCQKAKPTSIVRDKEIGDDFFANFLQEMRKRDNIRSFDVYMASLRMMLVMMSNHTDKNNRAMAMEVAGLIEQLIQES